MIDERGEKGLQELEVTGELDLSTAPRLCVALAAARRRGARRILVDLSAVEFCDSSALRSLIGERMEVEALGGRLAVVCTPDGPIARLFDITGAHEMLSIHTSADSARSALV